MRNLALALLVTSGLALVGTAPATAEPDYPVCMTHSLGGARECSYMNYQQCWATASGAGGYCFDNPYLTGTRAEQTPPLNGRRHRNH